MVSGSVTWSARREANDGYVLEEYHDGEHKGRKIEYGPMPPHIVPAFITARRRIVALMMEKIGASYVAQPPEIMQ